MKRNFYSVSVGILIGAVWLFAGGSGVAQQKEQPEAKEKSRAGRGEAAPESTVPR